MTYESTHSVTSGVNPEITYTVVKMSFERRTDLMRRIRELARQAEFLDAAQDAGGKMDAALLEAEIDRTYLLWGLREVSGLDIDGAPATPESLAAAGPEDLCREAAEAVRSAAGLTSAERKN